MFMYPKIYTSLLARFQLCLSSWGSTMLRHGQPTLLHRMLLCDHNEMPMDMHQPVTVEAKPYPFEFIPTQCALLMSSHSMHRPAYR